MLSRSQTRISTGNFQATCANCIQRGLHRLFLFSIWGPFDWIASLYLNSRPRSFFNLICGKCSWQHFRRRSRLPVPHLLSWSQWEGKKRKKENHVWELRGPWHRRRERMRSADASRSAPSHFLTRWFRHRASTAADDWAGRRLHQWQQRHFRNWQRARVRVSQRVKCLRSTHHIRASTLLDEQDC